MMRSAVWRDSSAWAAVRFREMALQTRASTTARTMPTPAAISTWIKFKTAPPRGRLRQVGGRFRAPPEPCGGFLPEPVRDRWAPYSCRFGYLLRSGFWPDEGVHA